MKKNKTTLTEHDKVILKTRVKKFSENYLNDIESSWWFHPLFILLAAFGSFASHFYLGIDIHPGVFFIAVFLSDWFYFRKIHLNYLKNKAKPKLEKAGLDLLQATTFYNIIEVEILNRSTTTHSNDNGQNYIFDHFIVEMLGELSNYKNSLEVVTLRAKSSWSSEGRKLYLYIVETPKACQHFLPASSIFKIAAEDATDVSAFFDIDDLFGRDISEIIKEKQRLLNLLEYM